MFELLLLFRVFGAAGCRLMRAHAGGGSFSNAVDLYNSTSGTWSTAQLSVARYDIVATSVGNVAIFAGGFGNCIFALCDGGFVLELLRADDACLRHVFVVALSCLRCSRLPSDEGRCWRR